MLEHIEDDLRALCNKVNILSGGRIIVLVPACILEPFERVVAVPFGLSELIVLEKK